MKKASVMLTALILICMLALTGCTDKKYVLSAGFGGSEIFRIDGNPCESKEVLVYLVNISNRYRQMYGDDFGSVSVNGVAFSDYVRQSSLDMVYKVKVMNLLAKTYGITLSSEEKKLLKAAADSYFDSLTDAERKAMGNVSKGDMRDYYEEYAISIKLYEYLIKDVNPEISDDDARTVVVKQIFIPLDGVTEGGALPYDIASEVYNKAIEGYDFDLLVAQYSSNDSQLLYVRKGELESNLEEAIFNLSNDQISQILVGSDGYYIYYCVSAADALRTEANKQEIIAGRQAEAFESIYNTYEAERKYYLNESLWEELYIPEGEDINTSSFFDAFDEMEF